MCSSLSFPWSYVLTFLPNVHIFDHDTHALYAKLDFGYYSIYGSGVNKNDKIRYPVN